MFKMENTPTQDINAEIGNDEFNAFPEFHNEMFEDVEQSVFEIVPGMTVEEMQTLFFDASALIEPPYKVWQLNSKGHRYYYRYDEQGNPEFYPSVTTILSQTMPKSPHLIKWIAERGIDEAERYKEERAAYGTFMHAAFEKLLINRKYDLDGLKGDLKEYIDYQKLPDDFIYYADDLKKDVLAFAQFVIDYDVKPLAVEIALVHPHFKYAGMIDLPCTMLDKIGGSNRLTSIVDFKSGKKGFFEEAELQLHMYREMWNANFPQHEIDRVYNFAPKDWRKRPTYNLKDQTKSPNAKKIPALLEIASIEDGKKDNVFTAVSGQISLDSNTDLVDNIISLTLSELIKKKAPKEKTPAANKGIKKEDLKDDKKKILNKKDPKTTAVTKSTTRVVKRTALKEQKTTPVEIKRQTRTNTPDKPKTSVKTTVKPKNENKANLLKDEPEI